jgi:hypothetical protein
MGKKILLAVVAIALIIPIGLAGIWIWGQAANPVAAQTGDAEVKYSAAEVITVVGQGYANVVPDLARISLGVETKGDTVRGAVDDNAAKMTAILEALEKAGIAEKDIQTSNFSIQQERNAEMMPRVEGIETEEATPTYRVSNMVTITVRDLEMIGDVLDTALEAGVNNMWGISFSTDDPAAGLEDARVKAIEDAQARAEALAELTGVQLGPVMSVSEVVGGGVSPVAVVLEKALVSGAGPVSPGELQVSYNVQVSYFIER